MSRAADARAILSRSFLFSKLSERELDELISLGMPRKIAREQVIFTRGSPSDRMFAVLQGRVRVVSYSDTGNEIIFRILEPGEVFGEIGVLDEGERTATAIATDACELLVLERKALLARLLRSPELALKLLAALAGRLRTTTELLEDLLFLNVPVRLAKKLLALAQTHGRDVGSGRHIEMRLTQEVLGNLIGTSRVSINQQMRAWKERGLIDMERGSVTLLDLDSLELIAEGAEETST